MEKLKLLTVLVNYGEEQLNYLRKVVNELLSFDRYDVTVVVHTNIQLDIPGIIVSLYPKMNNYQLLPLTCRKTIWDGRNDYDVFLYGENDHLFKEHHVDKYLEYTNILPNNRIAGLMQYEEGENGKHYPAYHARYNWDVDSVEIYGGKKFAHFTNLHQATFLLTQKQLLKIGKLYDFTQFFGKSHYSQKCKVNTDIYQFCGKKKLICIDEFDYNLIHHLPNIYIKGENKRLRLGSNDSRMRDKIKELQNKNIVVDLIESKYKELCDKKSDINEHLPVLNKYASECDVVIELGVRWIVSTWAFLKGSPKTLISYDIKHPRAFKANLQEVLDASKTAGINFKFIQADVLKTEIPGTDLLFIDTLHTYSQLSAELKLHAHRARKYIILHDTVTFGTRGEDGVGKGLKNALNEFLEINPQWSIKEEYKNNNGLTVLKRLSEPKLEKKRKLKFIVPFPDVNYYCWQVLVQINNFKKFGYDIDTHYLVGVFNKTPSKNVLKISEFEKVKSTFHFYIDERDNVSYTASLKTYLMSKYFQQHPWEKDNIYVYLDPDVIFLREVNWDPYMQDDTWYGSDTGSYLDSKYIKSKGDGLFEVMCKSANINPQLVISNDENIIGAQYITKNNTFDFWDKVWRKSTEMYNYLKNLEKDYFKPEMKHWLQIWTMEMWVTIWELWKSGIKTKHHNDLCFHWANHMLKEEKHAIFHNAGVTENDGKHFSKIHYQNSPFGKNIKCSPDSLSSKYKQEVIETEKCFKDIIWKI